MTTGNENLRVWTCTNFRGFNPVGVAAVVVAASEDDALMYLRAALREAGLDEQDWDSLEVTPVPMADGYFYVIVDGDY